MHQLELRYQLHELQPAGHVIRVSLKRAALSILPWVVLPLFAHSAISAQGSPTPITSKVEVGVETAGMAETLPREALLSFEPVGEESGKPTEATVSLTRGDGDIRLPLDPSSAWNVRAHASGYWSPVVTVPPGIDSRLVLTLWPAAALAVALVPSDEKAEVQELRVRLARASEAAEVGDQPALAKLVCEVSEDQVAECQAPEGRWHVRLQAPGFAPHFLWDRRIEAPDGIDLGKVALQRGGSLVGRVVTAEGPADPRRASVELRPLLDPGPMSAEKERALEQHTRAVQVNPWGYFQFVGVDTGSYRLAARQPGYVEAVRSTVHVDAPGATELEEALVLRRPVRLMLHVQPEAGPFGDPWTVRLHESSGSDVLKQVGEGPTDPGGNWTSPPVRPGEHLLEIVDGRGNRMAWRDVELERGSSRLEVDLPLAYVEGRVLLDEDPLKATLWFGGRTGSERVETESDEDGEFFTVLPRDGEWTVDVQADEPQVLSRGLEVEIELEAGLRLAEVVIEVPDTSIGGEVVDELGAPIADVGIRLSSYGPWRGILGAETDEVGRFEIHGMRPGPYGVEAVKGDRRSEPIQLTVAEELSPFLRLTLREERPMAGRVVSASGPVAAARVIGYPLTGSGKPATMAVSQARTDAQGRFQLRVPYDTSRVRLLVLAPGHGLKVTGVSEGEILQVELSREVGTLRLDIDEDEDRRGDFGVVVVQGEPIGLPRLITWARMNGSPPTGDGTLTVPAMPPGRYAYCRMRFVEALMVMVEAAVPSAEACTSGFLSAGRELALTAP